MTSNKRRLSESEAEEEAADAATEARENGLRAYRHWRDRGEPAASTAPVAMRQACPYKLGDARYREFFLGWHKAAGTAYTHTWIGSKMPERKGEPCIVVERTRTRLTIEFADGERVSTVGWFVRRMSA